MNSKLILILYYLCASEPYNLIRFKLSYKEFKNLCRAQILILLEKHSSEHSYKTPNEMGKKLWKVFKWLFNIPARQMLKMFKI